MVRGLFIAVCSLSVIDASGGYSFLWCTGFSLRWFRVLRSTGSRCMDSVVVVHRLSCPLACGVLDPGPGIEPVSSALAG